MTRTHFLLLLYKKLLRPALLLLVIYYVLLFTRSFLKGEDAAIDIFIVIAGIVAFIVIINGLKQGADYLIGKFSVEPAATSPESETTKVIGRLSDIAMGMVLLYMWQTNPVYAIGWDAAIAMGMRDDYKKQQAVKAE